VRATLGKTFKFVQFIQIFFLYETLPKEEKEEGKIQSLYTFEDHSSSLS